MIKFERYHPILSAHYRFDWLTGFKLKDVYALRANQQQAALSGREVDQKIEDTAYYVNQAMRLIMRNKALLYGIETRSTAKFIGSFCLWNFSEDLQQAQLRFELTDQTDAAEKLAEILPRMLGFAYFELGVARLYAILPATATVQLDTLRANHFTPEPYDHQRTMPDGTKVPLQKFSLIGDDIATDAKYHF